MSNADINIANGLGLIYIFNPKMNSRFGLTLYVYRRQTVDAIRCTSITATVDIVWCTSITATVDIVWCTSITATADIVWCTSITATVDIVWCTYITATVDIVWCITTTWTLDLLWRICWTRTDSRCCLMCMFNVNRQYMLYKNTCLAPRVHMV